MTPPCQTAPRSSTMSEEEVITMMGYGYGAAAGWSIFGLLTWILVIVFLILGIMYFWKEITKSKK